LLYRRGQSAAAHRFGWNNKSRNVSRVFFILVQDNKNKGLGYKLGK